MSTLSSTDSPACTVLLCDDHLLFGEALATVLQRAGFEVIGAVPTIAAALEVVTSRPVDICVMDLDFGRQSNEENGDGLEGVRRILAVSPTTRVAMLTASRARHLIADAIAAGAAGLARKDQRSEEIVRMIERVRAGEPAFELDLLRQAIGPGRRPSEAERLYSLLTGREREVLGRLVNGESTRAIARSMRVGETTARTHIQSVLTKLGVHTRLEAAAFAVRHDLPVHSAVPSASA